MPHARVRVPRVTLVDYLEVAARRYPDKPAIVYGGATTDYRSLRARVDALAAYLQQRLGVRQGDRVLLIGHNCPEFITAFYAALRAGAAIVPVSPMSTAEELRYYAEDGSAPAWWWWPRSWPRQYKPAWPRACWTPPWCWPTATP